MSAQKRKYCECQEPEQVKPKPNVCEKKAEKSKNERK